MDEIFNNDLEPFPTLYHWDLPIRFSKIGGWENKDTCKHFADYSYFVSQQFGDKFDIRYFHDEVLCDGGITLPILENKIKDFIQRHSV